MDPRQRSLFGFCAAREIRVAARKLLLRNKNAQFIDRSMKQKEPLFVALLLVVLGPPGVTELPDPTRVEVESRNERKVLSLPERGIEASFNMQAREGGSAPSPLPTP